MQYLVSIESNAHDEPSRSGNLFPGDSYCDQKECNKLVQKYQGGYRAETALQLNY